MMTFSSSVLSPVLFGQKNHFTKPPKSFKLSEASSLLEQLGALVKEDTKGHQSHPHRAEYNGSSRGITPGHGDKDGTISLDQIAHIASGLMLPSCANTSEAKKQILFVLNNNGKIKK